jgi:hypothetical protein
VSSSRPVHSTHGERAPGTHRKGDWVGSVTGLDDVEKRTFLTLPVLELRLLGWVRASRFVDCAIRAPYVQDAFLKTTALHLISVLQRDRERIRRGALRATLLRHTY